MPVPDPITRQEQFLAAAANGSTENLPEPITREEVYLKAIADNAAGGGGGGGSTTLAGLTDVDISNPSDGQTLVYNATSGKWENGAGTLLVHKNFNAVTEIFTLDATFAEIYAAVVAGRYVVIVYVDEEGAPDPDYPFCQIEQVASIGNDGDLLFATFSLVYRNIIEYRVDTINSYPETGGQT